MTPLWPFGKQALAARVQTHGVSDVLCWFGFELQVPYRELASVARRIAGFFGLFWQRSAGAVGFVGLLPEEEPVLVSYAPRKDLIAQRFLTSTVENPTHTFPQLWLLLPPGVFLAQAVDPSRSPEVSCQALQVLVASGLAGQALYLDPQFGRKSYRLSGLWVLPRGERRPLLSRVRAALQGP
ncbi:MAG: hypothetical protein ACOY7U_02720 [Acidobacteriota bacterium]